ncbi:MAG: VOC family protein [Deltaproteobacteria bacterium]|jgi:lactoylglutathione lyase|nr:VOC family protein [Deltaproteobacteria bacterium]
MEKSSSVANAQTPWSLKMTAPLEVAISVNDMDKMLKFYTETLGLKKVADAKVPPELTTKIGQTTHGFRVVRLATPYGEWIRLIQTGHPSEPNPIPPYVFDRHGLVYVSFLVTDIDSIVQRLKENGIKLQSGDTKVEVRPGLFVVYAVDPEGNFIEFLEVPDISSYRPDLFKYRLFY